MDSGGDCKMNLVIFPRKLHGQISVIPSKSQAHRYLICAAFADAPTHVFCPETSRDMDATCECLNALGATILRTDDGYLVYPQSVVPENADLYCKDSGSTLRFLLPVVGALGVKATFHLEGRLPQRPLSPLWEVIQEHGCNLSRPTENTILCQGKLSPGAYQINAGVSSQFISGLLFGLTLLPSASTLTLTGKAESVPYIRMTEQALSAFGIQCNDTTVFGNRKLHSPSQIHVEGDWSNGAFFLTARALGSTISILGLSDTSVQGDRAILQLLPMLQKKCCISAANVPDLVPVMAVFAACNQGAVFTDVQRLRLKESDRVSSVIEMLHNLGGRAEDTGSSLIVHGTGLIGGTVNSHNDHGIAMAAAIAATVCKENVTILGAECVEKSYPNFWQEYCRLGGKYEQHLRR